MRRINILLPIVIFSTCLTACESNIPLSDALLYADKANRDLNSCNIIEIIQRSSINDKEYKYSCIRYDYSEKYYSNEIKYTVTKDYQYKGYSIGTEIDVYDFTYLYNKTDIISGYFEIVGGRVMEGYLFGKEAAKDIYNHCFSNSVGGMIYHPFESLLEVKDDDYSKYGFYALEADLVSVKYKEKDENRSRTWEAKYQYHKLLIMEEKIVEDSMTYKEKWVYDYSIKEYYFHEQFVK